MRTLNKIGSAIDPIGTIMRPTKKFVKFCTKPTYFGKGKNKVLIERDRYWKAGGAHPANDMLVIDHCLLDQENVNIVYNRETLRAVALSHHYVDSHFAKVPNTVPDGIWISIDDVSDKFEGRILGDYATQLKTFNISFKKLRVKKHVNLDFDKAITAIKEMC